MVAEVKEYRVSLGEGGGLQERARSGRPEQVEEFHLDQLRTLPGRPWLLPERRGGRSFSLTGHFRESVLSFREVEE